MKVKLHKSENAPSKMISPHLLRGGGELLKLVKS